MELKKLNSLRASDEVYSALRGGIVDHLFKPGQRFKVEEIAAQLGVSLTPVRHAIQQLAAEGLIEVRPRSGTFVAQLNVRDVEETCELRTALECLAAETAVQRISRKEILELHELLERLNRPVRTDDQRTRHEEANRRFHRVLIEASGNRRLAELYESLNAHLQIARVHSRSSEWAARLIDEDLEHREIAAALEARELPRLKAALKLHIARARHSLIAAIEAASQDA